MRPLLAAAASALALTGLVACGPASYTDDAGACHGLSLETSAAPNGDTVYTGVRDGACPAPSTVTKTVTVSPTTTAPPTTSTEPPPDNSPFPTAATTGVPAGTQLATIPGGTAAALVEGKHVTGDLVISKPGTVVRNTWVDGKVTNASSGASFTLDHVTIGKTNGCDGDPAVQAKSYTATAVRVQGFSDGFRSTGVVNSANTGASNITIRDSFAKMCSNPGDHADGFQAYYGGSNVSVLHNTLDLSAADPSTQNAPLFSSDYSVGLVVSDNLLIGGSFSIRLDSDGKGTAGSRYTVTGNRVAAGSWVYGPSHSDCDNMAAWTDNRVVTLKPGTYSPADAGTALACA